MEAASAAARAPRRGGSSGSNEHSSGDNLSVVVGGFGQLSRDGAVRKIQHALYKVDGYLSCESFGAIPKVAFARFILQPTTTNSCATRSQYLHLKACWLRDRNLWQVE